MNMKWKCTEFVLLILSTFPISSLQVDRDHLLQGKLVIGLGIETPWPKILLAFVFCRQLYPEGRMGSGGGREAHIVRQGESWRWISVSMRKLGSIQWWCLILGEKVRWQDCKKWLLGQPRWQDPRFASISLPLSLAQKSSTHGHLYSDGPKIRWGFSGDCSGWDFWTSAGPWTQVNLHHFFFFCIWYLKFPTLSLKSFQEVFWRYRQFFLNFEKLNNFLKIPNFMKSVLKFHFSHSKTVPIYLFFWLPI